MRLRAMLIRLAAAALCLTACRSDLYSAAQPDVVEAAEAEATAILRQAQASVLVLEAQSKATALVAEVNARDQAVQLQSTTSVQVQLTYTPAPLTMPTLIESGEEIVTKEIEVLSVGFAADSGMVIVRFLAPPEEAEKWWQGDLAVTDEESTIEYNEVPVMPRIGPLISRPKRDGQQGYFMLVNSQPYLEPGDTVTVRMGKYSFEHIPVH